MTPQEKLAELAQILNLLPKTILDTLYNRTLYIPQQTLSQIMLRFAYEGEGTFVCLISPKKQAQSSKFTSQDMYMRTIIEAARPLFDANNYTLTLHIGNVYLNDEAYYEHLLLKAPNSGFVVVIPHHIDLIKVVCEKHQRPCVFIDAKNVEENPLFVTISVSNQKSMERALHHLVDLGHRRIAFITGMMTMPSAIERLEGYKQGLATAQIPYDADLVKEGDWGMGTAHRLTLELLQAPQPPTAIIASNDLSAIGVVEAAQARGVNVPQDLSVVGFDDVEMAATINPPLTTFHQPLKQMGELAAENLLGLLSGARLTELNIDLEAELIIRQSTSQARRQR